MLYECETCKGSGWAGYEPCSDCYGAGEVPGGSTPEEFDRSRQEWLAKHSTD